jgi:hypothetical protein
VDRGRYSRAATDLGSRLTGMVATICTGLFARQDNLMLHAGVFLLLTHGMLVTT